MPVLFLCLFLIIYKKLLPKINLCGKISLSHICGDVFGVAQN